MNAWFGPDVAVWFSFLSLLATAAALETLAKRGKQRALVTGVYYAGLALGVVLLGLGVVALVLDQPWYVVFPLLWSGAVMTPAFGWGQRGIRRMYEEAEARRIVAKNL
jgi:CHASE2 domain-containing sensor protein